MSEAVLFSIQHFSTEDGPGIRTTLFFKGCPLRCAWCHNPEGMRQEVDLVWGEQDCMRCGDCTAACPNRALQLSEERIVINRKACHRSGACIEACDVAALELIGKRWTTKTLLAEAAKDSSFYATSNGGVTLSGGEPTIYADFLAEFLPKLREKKIHIALDTCGYTSPQKLFPILENVDLVLFDLKVLDEEKHQAFTGVSLQLILENAKRIAEKGVPLWIRTPVIPRYTETDENIQSIARFIVNHLPTVERYDLLAFSNLCTSKYRKLGIPFPLENAPLLTRSRLDTLVAIAKGEGVVSARWSGPVREEEKRHAVG